MLAIVAIRKESDSRFPTPTAQSELIGPELDLEELDRIEAKEGSRTEEGEIMKEKISSKLLILNRMAERVGFEPTIPVKVYTLSKRAPSATRPSLPGSGNASSILYGACNSEDLSPTIDDQCSKGPERCNLSAAPGIICA